MTYSVGGVTLPIVTADKEGRSKDGLKTLVLSGSTDGSQSWATLKTAFVDALLALVAMYEVFEVEGGSYPRISIIKGDVVAVVSTGGVYDGNWVLADASFNAIAEGTITRYKFTLQLVQGSAHDVL